MRVASSRKAPVGSVIKALPQAGLVKPVAVP
jgi:hypothetical protein